MFPFVHVDICEFNKTNKPCETRIYAATEGKMQDYVRLCVSLLVHKSVSLRRILRKSDWILAHSAHTFRHSAGGWGGGTMQICM